MPAWIVVVWVCVAMVMGCSDSQPVTPDATAPDWRCPATWVPYARGGCGPAVLLCTPDGGAAPRACDGVDLSRAPAVVDGDGGVATGFWRAPDGAIRGAWKEPGEPGGPPARDWHPPALDGLEQRVPAANWAPDAGIPSCPAGWARTPDGVCDPRLPTDCPEGSGALPGGGCTRTAERDCPSGTWPDPGAEAIGASVVRVREGADDTTADGSAARPYGTITAALTAAPDNAWVLVGAGRYPERLRFVRSVHLVGVCAARVTIAEPMPYEPMRFLLVAAPDLNVSLDLRGVSLRNVNGWFNVAIAPGSRARLRELRMTSAYGGIFAEGAGTSASLEDVFYQGVAGSIADAPRPALYALRGAVMTASRVHIHRPAGHGVLSQYAAALDLRDALVRDLRPFHTTMGGSYGVVSGGGGTLRAARVVVTGTPGTAFASASPDSLLVAEDVVATGTRSFKGLVGAGLLAFLGGRIEARRALLDDSTGSGAMADSRGSVLIEDSVTRATTGQGGETGSGFEAFDGGRLEARRVVSERNRGAGAVGWGVSSELLLHQCILRDNLVDRDGSSGIGLGATEGAVVSGREILIERSAQSGVYANLGGRLQLRDSLVANTRATERAMLGNGFYVGVDARLEAERVRVVGTTGHGAYADEGGLLVLRDALIDPPTSVLAAVALHAEPGARLVASRVRVTAGHAFGARAQGGRIELEDAWIEALTPRGVQGNGALFAMNAGTIDATRVRVEGGSDTGVRAEGTGARVLLRDAVVRGVRSASDGTNGFGAFAWQGGSLGLSRVLLSDAQHIGVVAQDRGSLALEDVVVEGTLPRSDGTHGYGVLVSRSEASLRGVVLRGNHDFGLSADERATLDARDVAVFDTAPVFDGTDSAAVGLRSGARATLVRALLSGNAHSALIVQDQGTHLDAVDLLVTDTRATRLGFGVGVGASEGASVSVTRVAVVRSGGFAVGAVRRVVGGASFEASELFVRDVSDRAVRNTFPQGPSVAYGVTVGAECSSRLSRATVIDAGWGFFQTAGALRWREGVIAGSRDGPGAVSGVSDRAASELDAVRFVDSATSAVARDVALPEVLLPPPPTPCALPPCSAR